MSSDDVPVIDSGHAATLEIQWLASEGRALMSAPPDDARRERFTARKRALLDYLERQDEGGRS